MSANLPNQLSKASIAGAATNAGIWTSFHLDRRTILTALLGASIGFGLGITFHSIWRGIVDLYGQRPQNNLAEQLASLKAELLNLRTELRSTNVNVTKSNLLDRLPDFYISDDEDDFDKFFDFESENDASDGFMSFQQSPKQSNGFSDATSFQSALSHVSSSTSISQLGPPVPNEILTELDNLADFAMGEYPSSTPKPIPGGDEVSPGMQAYARCLLYRSKYRRSPEFLWRFARATYLASEGAPTDEQDVRTINDGDGSSNVASNASLSLDPSNLNDVSYEIQTRRQYIEAGLRIARRALHLVQKSAIQSNIDENPIKTAPVYKWLAIFVGLASDFLGVQQKITYGFEFKELIDKALELDESDPLCHYLKGRWCYQVYNLSWIERQVASRLFATPPTATIEEAIAEFDRVEELRPNHFAAAYLYRAKCSIVLSDYQTAAKYLEKANCLFDQHRYPLPHTDTGTTAQEIKSLYNKYSSYI